MTTKASAGSEVIDWYNVWMVLAFGAGLITALFALLFDDRIPEAEAEEPTRAKVAGADALAEVP